jgi:Lambda phage tail tube protein, TTP
MPAPEFLEHATKAHIGWGAFLAIGATVGTPDSDTFSVISELVSVAPPDEQGDDVEVTHFGSPNRTKEYIRGLIDAGEATFSVNYNPIQRSDHALLVNLKKSGAQRNIRIVLPPDEEGGPAMETIDFPGYIKGLKRNLDPSGAVTLDVTLKVAGAVVSDLETT